MRGVKININSCGNQGRVHSTTRVTGQRERQKKKTAIQARGWVTTGGMEGRNQEKKAERKMFKVGGMERKKKIEG